MNFLIPIAPIRFFARGCAECDECSGSGDSDVSSHAEFLFRLHVGLLFRIALRSQCVWGRVPSISMPCPFAIGRANQNSCSYPIAPLEWGKPANAFPVWEREFNERVAHDTTIYCAMACEFSRFIPVIHHFFASLSGLIAARGAGKFLRKRRLRASLGRWRVLLGQEAVCAPTPCASFPL